MIENKNVISSFCFLSMLFLGVGATLIGAAARNIGLTPFQIGLILSVQNFGFMLAVTVSGALADTYEKPNILFVGSIILAASFLTFYVTDSFFLNLVITLAGIMYKDVSGTVMGIIKLAIPVGGISIPFLLSVLSKYASLELSLLLFPSIALVGFLILILSRKAFQSHLEHF